jgi:hypothetical protein
MSAHALLGPSAADRWINCPPSARATEHIEDVGSPYAEEGTLIHALGELKLRAWIDNHGAIPDYEYDTLKANKHYSQEVEDAADYYVAYVKERYSAALAVDPTAQIRSERVVDLTDAIPEGFGTADCFITYDKVIESIDLKGGRGIYVSAHDNAQTRLYAYGVLKQVEILYDVEAVVCTIVQPRMDSISTEKLTKTELLDWIESIVKPAAAIAWAGKGEFKAGDHCQWCKIKGTCRARANQHLGDVASMFAQPSEGDTGVPVRPAPTLTPAEIAALLPQLDLVKQWVGEVQAHALQLAQDGTEIPGFKVVHGRAVRKIEDQEPVIAALAFAKIPEAVVFERSLLGLTALEKALGKKQFTEIVGPFVTKPPGRPTLVQESDRREAINNVADTAELFRKSDNE